jgi:molybdopterin-guanine dinucleotide biosynthesis protein A
MRMSRTPKVECRAPAGVTRSASLDPRLSTLDQDFSAVILAGGKSSRMGLDKAWLEVDGQRLLERQIARVRAAGAVEVFISGRADMDYAGFGVPVLHDQFAGAGPLAGVERALATSGSPMLLVLAVDLAAMSVDLLRQLAAGCAPEVGVIPRVQGNLEPLAAIYPKSALALARSQLAAGSFAVKDFAERAVHGGLCRYLELGPGSAANFANWNSPADMVRATGPTPPAP